MIDIFKYLENSIPNDHCRQTRLAQLLSEKVKNGYAAKNILDLGCGDGRSLSVFNKLMPQADWTGVDIEISPEVNSRKLNNKRFITYDGVRLPFKNKSFDLVYSHQVFEHIRYPELVLKEIKRILTKDGLFIGQTSQFEPYHSYSLWNFTVYGFKKIVEDAGMKLIELRPAIDGFTLMRRVYEGRPPSFDKYAHVESPINVEIEENARREGKSNLVINYRKLMFAGQFTFICSV